MPLAVLCHPWSGAWLDGRLDAAAPVIGPATTNNCLGTSNLSAALHTDVHRWARNLKFLDALLVAHLDIGRVTNY
jgi:hypothetical protein